MHDPTTRPLQVIVLASDAYHTEAVDAARQAFGVLTRPRGRPLEHGPGVRVSGPHADVPPELGSGPLVVIAVEREDPLASSIGARPGVEVLHQGAGEAVPRQSELVAAAIRALRGVEPPVGSAVNSTVTTAGAPTAAWPRPSRSLAVRVLASPGCPYIGTLKTAIQAQDGLRQAGESEWPDVAIVMQGDDSGLNGSLQAERIALVTRRVPVVTALGTVQGEARAAAHGGHNRTVVLAANSGEIVRAAALEWIAASTFLRRAQKIMQRLGLPSNTHTLTHAPRLVDLTEVPLGRRASSRGPGDRAVLLHPDPELSTADLRVLRRARPGLVALTPRTLYRRDLARRRAAVEVPLRHLTIGLSISDRLMDDALGPLLEEHVLDACLGLSQALLGAGASLAYAGDARPGGFTQQLAALHERYDDVRGDGESRLVNHRPAHPKLARPVAFGRATSRDTALPPGVAPEDALDDATVAAIYSQLRRVVIEDTDARIVLGGNLVPRTASKRGYGGPLPGVVEEAALAMEANQPLYLLGGFGGAARALADLATGEAVPGALREATWTANTEAPDEDPYALRMAAMRARYAELGMDLPETLSGWALALRDRLHLLEDRGDQHPGWNGLTRDENRRLMASTDVDEIVHLIMRGLVSRATRQASGKRSVELLHGAPRDASDLDVLVVPYSRGWPSFGLAAEVDRLSGGALAAAAESGEATQSMGAGPIDALLLHALDIGDPHADANAGESAGPHSGKEIRERFLERLAEAVRTFSAQGYRRIGLMSPELSHNGSEDGPLAVGVVNGLKDLDAGVTLQWIEPRERRIRALSSTLKYREDVAFTQRTASSANAPVLGEGHVFCGVRLSGEDLHVWIVPPGGTSIGLAPHSKITRDELKRLTDGVNSFKESTPSPDDLRKRGFELARHMFGDQAASILGQLADVPWCVAHDVGAACLPFELLLAGNPEDSAHDRRPSLEGGLHRRLMVHDVPASRIFHRPPVEGRMRVGVVMHLAGEDAAFREEAMWLQEKLDGSSELLLSSWVGDKTTAEHLLEALDTCDVVHFIGHGFHAGPLPIDSGLILQGGPFLRTQLDEAAAARPGGFHARLLVMNACESARHGDRTRHAAEDLTFAGHFLTGGIEALLGTFWRVPGIAALALTKNVYDRLARGLTVHEAVRRARAELEKDPELGGAWGNYHLYGDGDFPITAGQA